MRTARSLQRVPTLLLLSACLSLGGCMAGTSPAPSTPPAGVVDPLREIARREGAVPVVVALAVEQERPGSWNRREVVRAHERLLQEIRPGVRVVRRFYEFPQIALRVTAPALRRLRQSDLVVNITLDRGGDADQ